MSGFPSDRPVVMGVLNCTPDSFSGDGRYRPDGVGDSAHALGLRLVAEGADVVDVGGESTRPGANPVSAAQQLDRILPVVRTLAAEGVVVSVDTCAASVAEAALANGASMVNDVSGGLCDPFLVEVAARAQAWLVLGHWPGAPSRDHGFRAGGTTPAHVARELRERADAALAAGVRRDRIILDPGLGFGKSQAENWALVRGLGELRGLGFPVLVGASRKRFLGSATIKPTPSKVWSTTTGGDEEHDQRAPVGSATIKPTPSKVWSTTTGGDEEHDQTTPVGSGSPNFDESEHVWREAGTVAVTTLVAALGAWGVRVHEPRPNLAAVLAVAAFSGKEAIYG